MQDAENVAAPEAAEPGQQPQTAAEPPPGEEPPRSTGPGAQEAAGGEDAEAGPEPDVLAKSAEPAANGEERAASVPGSSPPPPSEEPPAAGEAPAEQAGDAAAEARSEGAGGEDCGADEPSFSDPEDFVDDVSEEGEATWGWVGGRGVPALHLSYCAYGRPSGDVWVFFPVSFLHDKAGGGGQLGTTWESPV